MQKDSPARARGSRMLLTPLLMISAAVLTHDVILHVAIPQFRDNLVFFDLLDAALALVLTTAILEMRARFETERSAQAPPPRRAFGDADGADAVQHLIARKLDEHSRELAESRETLKRVDAERSHAERLLQRQSTLDPLTGLLKRGAFLEKLEKERAAAPRDFAVFFIDLDHFKIVNDGLGDAIADRALIVAGDRIGNIAAPHSIAGRVGGDEFALGLPVQSQAEAMRLAERLLETIAQPIAVDGERIHVSASVGVRYSDRRDDLAGTLLRDAHTAMHRAKFDGRARYVVFEPSMRDEVETRYALNNDLHRAVVNQEIFVEYQPTFNLFDGRVTGYEALARWEHPNRGRVEPGVFIPAAEDSGLVAAIGEQVLADACRQILARNLTPATPVGINFSARQLAQPNLADMIAQTLVHFDIDPLCFLIEITESTLVESMHMARDVLGQLKHLGLRLAIDDFGTGYSSLSYLHELPFDVLKIDRSFVRHVHADEHARDIVRMIVTLAESLDLSVVAEGIETQEQLAALRDLGCYRGQGYLFARPLPADDAFAVGTQTVSASGA